MRTERIPPHLLPDRNPGAYPQGRACSCGATLRRTNAGPLCAPCQLAAMPVSERIDEILDSVDMHPAA